MTDRSIGRVSFVAFVNFCDECSGQGLHRFAHVPALPTGSRRYDKAVCATPVRTPKHRQTSNSHFAGEVGRVGPSTAVWHGRLLVNWQKIDGGRGTDSPYQFDSENCCCWRLIAARLERPYYLLDQTTATVACPGTSAAHLGLPIPDPSGWPGSQTPPNSKHSSQLPPLE